MAGRWQVAVGRLHLEIGRCQLAWWQLEACRIYLVRGSLRLADGWSDVAGGRQQLAHGMLDLAGCCLQDPLGGWQVAGGSWQVAL